MAPAEAVAGLRNWRLQGSVAATTYLVFPLLGIVLFVALGSFLDAGLLAGVLFLAALPSTVQSCVVFTSIARGNVPGAVVSATVSNLAGIAITPLLAALLLAEPTASLDAANRDVAVALIREAKAAGAAVVGIFHDADVRDRVADRLFTIEPRPEASRSAA